MFKNALIIVIYKKSSKHDCGNYHLISLLRYVYKLFMSIITARVNLDIYVSFPETQSAYQPGRGTIEQILTIKKIIEKFIRIQQPSACQLHWLQKCFWHRESTQPVATLKQSLNKCINLPKETCTTSTVYIRTYLETKGYVNILKLKSEMFFQHFCIIIAALLSL